MMKKMYFGGWFGSITLLCIYLFTEIGIPNLGGNAGAFLFVTSHFIVMPLASAVVIIVTTMRIFRAEAIVDKLVVLSSMLIPLSIIFIAVTGDFTLPQLLNLNFNR